MPVCDNYTCAHMTIRKERLLDSGVAFYAVSLSLLLYEYPFWRHIGYHEHPGAPDWAYRRAAMGNYAGLAGVITLIGIALPVLTVFVAVRKFERPKGRKRGGILVGVLSLLLLNGYFFYSGVYQWGKPLPFPIHFDTIMFFSEFQFLNLVVGSPVLALTAALLSWWLFSIRSAETRLA
jgi:hypothetical protein